MKDKNRIGPVEAGRILELYEAGVIGDSTLVWNEKEEWAKWRRFGECRAEICETPKVRRRFGHLRGLARNTMFFRAFLVSSIAVMGVQVFLHCAQLRAASGVSRRIRSGGGRRIQNLDSRGGQDIVVRKLHAGGDARSLPVQVFEVGEARGENMLRVVKKFSGFVFVGKFVQVVFSAAV